MSEVRPLDDRAVIEEQTLGIQFVDLEQQKEVASLGMWIFLATEVLFFGGLFMAYSAYRVTYSGGFAAAGKKFDLTIGTINTGVLLISSYFMALAVRSIRLGKVKATVKLLAATWGMGFAFLMLKAYEYYDDFKEGILPSVHIKWPGPGAQQARMLFYIYYAMTGLHALHLSIGLAVVAAIIYRTRKGLYSKFYYNPVEVAGLYWHFIDIVWIFLYPLLYLIDRHK